MATLYGKWHHVSPIKDWMWLNLIDACGNPLKWTYLPPTLSLCLSLFFIEVISLKQFKYFHWFLYLQLYSLSYFLTVSTLLTTFHPSSIKFNVLAALPENVQSAIVSILSGQQVSPVYLLGCLSAKFCWANLEFVFQVVELQQLLRRWMPTIPLLDGAGLEHHWSLAESAGMHTRH